MAHAANILDFKVPVRGKVPNVAAPAFAETAQLGPARLIPGMQSAVSAQRKVQPAWIVGRVPQLSRTSLKQFAALIVPEFLRSFPPSALGALILDLASIFIAYVLGGLALRSAGIAAPSNWATFCFYLSAFIGFAIQEGLYRSHPLVRAKERLAPIKVVLWTTLLTAFALECSPARPSLTAVFLLAGVSLCSLLLTRHITHAIRRGSAERRGVLIVGTGSSAQKLAEAIYRDPQSRLAVRAFVSESDCRDFRFETLSRIAREEFVDEIIIATQDRGAVRVALQEGRRNQLDVRIAPDFPDARCAEVPFECIGGMPLLKIHEERLPEWSLALKRVADVSLSAVGLVIVSPLLAAIAGIIRLDSSGSVLYRAARVGRKGQQFICYKFRTMVRDADSLKNELRSRNERAGAFFKISKDPRITRVGSFLRRYSLDELPQLWNVLLGDMSLVGPRPHPVDDVNRYGVQHLRRLDFIPGMTGLWQVTARQDPSFERNVALDLEYITRWSLWLDFQILCKTISAVFQGSGA